MIPRNPQASPEFWKAIQEKTEREEARERAQALHRIWFDACKKLSQESREEIGRRIDAAMLKET